MTEGLTDRQSAMLTLLRGSPTTPSYKEMQDALGIASLSTIHRAIVKLEMRGYIERIDGEARSIRVLDTPRPIHSHADAFLAQATTGAVIREAHRRGYAVRAIGVA